jgi:hypothetical protein
MNFISQLRQRNPLLFWFGLFNIVVGIICLILIAADKMQILGVSRWLKPMKFYFSVGLMILTMGWLLHYLNNLGKIKRFSWFLVISMFFENGLILLQAIRNTTSHFNIRTGLDSIIFNLMGIFIIIFTVTCIRICISFFRQKQFSIPEAYVWGLRLGILFFVVFSIEGGAMLAMMKHTVGAPDGTAGIPVLNWSKQYGDLRIAHFIGIHSLQVLPLFAYYVAKNKSQMQWFAAGWFAFATILFVIALKGVSLFAWL